MTKIGESETKDLCLVRVKHDHIGVGLFSVSDEYDLHLLIDELTDPDSCEYTVVTRSVGIFFSDAPIPNLHEPDDSDYKSDEEANKAAEHFNNNEDLYFSKIMGMTGYFSEIMLQHDLKWHPCMTYQEFEDKEL